MNITIEQTVEATLEARDLIRELNDVLGAAYEAHQRHGLSIEQLFESNVLFFVARLDGLAVGCGVAVFDDYAEVKRMYTRPAARSRGVAKAFAAQDRGGGSSSGQVGTYQQEAIGLYESMGFRPQGPFGPYEVMPARNIETSLFFEKVL